MMKMSELKDVRLTQLKKLVDKYRSQENLAAEINRGIDPDENPISPTQISNALAERRLFGDKICRKVERALKLPKYWLEEQDEIPAPQANHSPINAEINPHKLSAALYILIKTEGKEVLKLPVEQLSELLAEEYNSLSD